MQFYVCRMINGKARHSQSQGSGALQPRHRETCEYPNLKAIILEKHPNGTLWKLGCKSGILDQWYGRDQFQPTLEKI